MLGKAKMSSHNATRAMVVSFKHHLNKMEQGRGGAVREEACQHGVFAADLLLT